MTTNHPRDGARDGLRQGFSQKRLKVQNGLRLESATVMAAGRHPGTEPPVAAQNQNFSHQPIQPQPTRRPKVS